MLSMTPMMQQYTKIKQAHQDAILFFRLGDFYEMFLDDALLASRELEITLTSREGGSGSKIPMCGVPFHAAENYLAKLVAKGYKVAICEQMEDPKAVKGIVKREVIRIVTPGTLIESSMLQETKHNYLIAISHDQIGYGLAYTDISTGEFSATEIFGDFAKQKLIDEVSRINPAECLLPLSLYHDESFRNSLSSGTDAVITKVPEENYSYAHSVKYLLEHFQAYSLDAMGMSEYPQAVSAAGAVLAFLQETQKKDLQYLQQPRLYSTTSFMMMDAQTRRNLELSSTIRGGQRKGSLLWVLDKTETSLGARLLKQWIEKPLVDQNQILERLATVAELIGNPFVREDLKHLFKKIYDLERLIGRISYGNANARDLIALRNSISVLPEAGQLLAALTSPMAAKLYQDFDPLEDIYLLIEQSIEEDPPFTTKEGGIIRKGYDERVDELRLITKSGRQWIAELEAAEKAKTGIKSLKVGFNKVFGYYIEVTNANLSMVPGHYLRKQTLSNAERYITEDLKEWENKILGAREGLADREFELFSQIRERIAAFSQRIQKTALIIATIDVLISYAQVAEENHYCRPEITESGILHISSGRHPVVEKIMGNEYVPNDTYLDNEEQQICLLTGPNMAGKSTYMRQVALCVLMAQIGCYVPASGARIGLVDRIFTRVGAADDLSAGQSTFMVEMCETSNILKNATPSSLVILDEIGRGTSTYDGLSIAWAVVEYLLKPEIGSKTLFATHYHELTELAERFSQVKNYSVAVKEKEGEIIFLRKIISGGTDKSYGIQVAKLAGLPQEVLQRAKEILLDLEQNQKPSAAAEASAVPKPVQTRLFLEELPVHPLIAEIESIDLNNLTPLDALLKIDQWQKNIKTGGDQQ